MKLTARIKLFVLVVFCVAPMAVMIYGLMTMGPRPKASAGVLIDPPVPAPNAFDPEALFGKVPHFEALKGRWLLVSLAGGACDEACGRRLFIQRQLWTLMDKERPRMQTVWFVTDAEPINPVLKDKLTDEVVYRVDSKRVANWFKPAEGKDFTQSFYLVDPHGNWMMRFPADESLAVEETIKKDLERLLKASAAWAPAP